MLKPDMLALTEEIIVTVMVTVTPTSSYCYTVAEVLAMSLGIFSSLGIFLTISTHVPVTRAISQPDLS